MKRYLIGVIAVALLASGCAAPQTQTGKGAAYGTAIGAVTGAVAGQIIGRDTKATVIGAAVGAAAGAAIGGGVGHMMDKQQAEYEQALATSEAAAVRREGDLLKITLKGDLTFDTNKTDVKPGLLGELERIAQVMVQYPDTRITVSGHTDSVGDERYNQDLSERRAEAVKVLLVDRGVGADRIRTVGYGENMPVAGNDTPEGRRMNRRVEIRIDPVAQASG